MAIYLEKIKNPQISNLSTYIDESKNVMTKFKSKAFESAFIKDLINDKFEYLGTQTNTILVEDIKTKEPVELRVDYEQVDINPNLIREDWNLYDKNWNLIGTKYYGIEKRFDNKFHMLTGMMCSLNDTLKGIGTRLDQLQIERALQLGIKNIPRTAQPQATYYHTMMGFMPVSRSLVRIENNLEDTMKRIFDKYETIDFDPILVEKDGQIFIDVNKTLANANLEKCLNFCKTNKRKIGKIEGPSSALELSGEELNKWKEIIQNHSLLDKLDYSYPNF